MRILGLDNSTNRVGWAVFDELTLENYGVIELEKEIKNYNQYLNKDYLERIALMKDILIKMVSEHNIDVVVFEDVALKSFGGKTGNNQVDVFKKLSKALGVYEICLIDRQLAFETAPANIWRKGKGFGRERHEIKRNTILWVNEKFGLDLKEYDPKDKNADDDKADAIGLGYYMAQKFSK